MTTTAEAPTTNDRYKAALLEDFKYVLDRANIEELRAAARTFIRPISGIDTSQGLMLDNCVKQGDEGTLRGVLLQAIDAIKASDAPSLWVEPVRDLVKKYRVAFEARESGGAMPREGFLMDAPSLSLGVSNWNDGTHSHELKDGRLRCKRCFAEYGGQLGYFGILVDTDSETPAPGQERSRPAVVPLGQLRDQIRAVTATVIAQELGPDVTTVKVSDVPRLVSACLDRLLELAKGGAS